MDLDFQKWILWILQEKWPITIFCGEIYWVVNQISYLITFVSGGSYTTSSTTMYVYRKLHRVVEWTNEASQ